MSETPNQVHVVNTNLNLAPRDALTWGVAEHRQFLKDTGYDSMTYYPLHSRMGWDISRSEPVDDIVTGFLQNWRESSRIAVFDKALIETARAIPQGIRAAVETFTAEAGPLVMPHLKKSLGVIANLQTHISKAGGDLRPVIVHPEGQMLGDGLRNARRKYTAWAEGDRVGELLWQPTADFAFNRGIWVKDSEMVADRMVMAAQGDGLGRAAYDTGHGASERRTSSHDVHFVDPVAIAARLSSTGQVARVELSVQPHFQSVNNLKDIMDGNLTETPQGEAIQAIYENLPPKADIPEMGVEIPQYAFKAIGIMDYREGHRRLQPMVRSFVNEILAKR